MSQEPLIPFNRPFIAGKELFYMAQAVWEHRHLAGDGHFSKLCHQWLERELGCQAALLTHSCTAALEMAALLLDIRPGDEVIVPSFTFVSTANAFVMMGGVPVFVDIRPDTLNLDHELIAGAITKRTKAIVPVHYAGIPCQMDDINRIAAEHGLMVIEDAAHAFLSTYHGRYAGTLGQLGCLSFHETKNIICGEGGALLINDERLAARAEVIREKGTNRSAFFKGEVDKYTWVDVGSSYLPSELVGAFLYAQLENARDITAAREAMFQRYLKRLAPLAEVEGLRLPCQPQGCQVSGHMFYLITASEQQRAELIAFLDQRNIKAVFHYVPLHSSPAGIKYGRAHGDLAVTDDISGRLVRLPLFFDMTDEMTDRVTAAIMEFYG